MMKADTMLFFAFSDEGYVGGSGIKNRKKRGKRMKKQWKSLLLCAVACALSACAGGGEEEKEKEVPKETHQEIQKEEVPVEETIEGWKKINGTEMWYNGEWHSYSFEEDSGTITAVGNMDGRLANEFANVKIPASIAGIPVNAVEYKEGVSEYQAVFDGGSMESLTLSDSVKSIRQMMKDMVGDASFGSDTIKLKLAQINVIGSKAIVNSALSDFTIPASCTSIAADAISINVKEGEEIRITVENPDMTYEEAGSMQHIVSSGKGSIVLCAKEGSTTEAYVKKLQADNVRFEKL